MAAVATIVTFEGTTPAGSAVDISRESPRATGVSVRDRVAVDLPSIRDGVPGNRKGVKLNGIGGDRRISRVGNEKRQRRLVGIGRAAGERHGRCLSAGTLCRNNERCGGCC